MPTVLRFSVHKFRDFLISVLFSEKMSSTDGTYGIRAKSSCWAMFERDRSTIILISQAPARVTKSNSQGQSLGYLLHAFILSHRMTVRPFARPCRESQKGMWKGQYWAGVRSTRPGDRRRISAIVSVMGWLFAPSTRWYISLLLNQNHAKTKQYFGDISDGTKISSAISDADRMGLATKKDTLIGGNSYPSLEEQPAQYFRRPLWPPQFARKTPPQNLRPV